MGNVLWNCPLVLGALKTTPDETETLEYFEPVLEIQSRISSQVFLSACVCGRWMFLFVLGDVSFSMHLAKPPGCSRP
jgi:hypothetical protein